MSAASRRQRGHETETTVAAYMRDNGFRFAEPVGAGRGGRDVTGTPGVNIEVKARRDLDLPAWLRQSQKAAGGELPVVVHRPDGFGPASVADWPATLRFEDLTTLLRLAGYGDPIEGERWP